MSDSAMQVKGPKAREGLEGETMYRKIMTAVSVLAMVVALLAVAVAVARSNTASAICETGSRGQKAYNAHCLKTGRISDAARLWFSTPEGRKGHERDDFMDRRSICKYARTHGGVRNRAAELVADMTHDAYRNDKQVNGWVADAAQGDCLRLGYADPVSGLAAVNLRSLPPVDRRCWFEVYYMSGKRFVKREAICNA